jgi:uncharacterized Zn finger protein
VEEAPKVRKNEFPMTGVLIDIAIEEKRPDDVLKWYDHRKLKKQVFGEGTAIKRIKLLKQWQITTLTAPWRYGRMLLKTIAVTQPKVYEAAARYLRKVHVLLKRLQRESEWKDYLLKLRQPMPAKETWKFYPIEARRIVEAT